MPYSSAGNQGLIQSASLDHRLFGLMGFTRLERSLCGMVAGSGISETQGSGNGIDPEEIVHSRFIVLWGTNTIVTNLHLWPVILGARKRGAKIVVTIELHRGIWIHGRVMNQITQEPVVGARMYYLPWQSNPFVRKVPEFQDDSNADGDQTRYQTDQNGNYRLVGLPVPAPNPGI